MKTKSSKICLVVLAVISASVLFGCATTEKTVARFSIVSTKNIDIGKLSNAKRVPYDVSTQKLNKVTLFTSKTMENNYVLENALDDALKAIPGAVALVDVKLKYITEKRGASKKYGYVWEGTALVDQSGFSEAEKYNFDENTELYFIEDNGIQTQVTAEGFCVAFSKFVTKNLRAMTKRTTTPSLRAIVDGVAIYARTTSGTDATVLLQYSSEFSVIF